MRVDATAISSLVGSLTELSARQADISSSLSSGIRITRPGDDAVASAQGIVLAHSIQQDSAFLTMAGTAAARMQATDAALDAVVTQMTSALSIAVGAGDDSSAAGRPAAVQQLIGVRQSLLSLANSSYNGSYLFSGSQAVAPFTEASDGSVTYAGDEKVSSIALTSGGSVRASLAGSSVFMATDGSVFGALNDLISALSASSFDGSNEATLVGNLRNALGNVTSQRATINAAQTSLSGESDYITAQKANLQVQQTSLLHADTAALATELSAVTTQRSALLSTISIIEKGTLFDYL